MKIYSEQYRREVVRDFESSSMGPLAFCRERGVSVASLAIWRKRYGSQLSTPATTAGGWLSVHLEGTETRSQTPTACYAIRLPSASLEVPSGFVPSEVATLLGLLHFSQTERNQRS